MVHFASKAHALSERPGSFDGYREVIVDGTRRLLAAAERTGVQRFVFLSSVKACGEGQYPSQPPRCLGEADAAQPSTPYGICKADA